ncbi:Transmembrane protein 218 [Frankliniella fusca]|uniref:Transmembrane protein 218 n=1 Tax=Frankliniella fusca TaxID=407009 RepID=A0AAE1H6T0_9NEOP|nr:Transmembrane protein 218 [Frankliniella fusca]
MPVMAFCSSFLYETRAPAGGHHLLHWSHPVGRNALDEVGGSARTDRDIGNWYEVQLLNEFTDLKKRKRFEKMKKFCGTRGALYLRRNDLSAYGFFKELARKLLLSVMSAIVLGVGFGLFLLVGIWLGALLACFVSAHTQNNFGIQAVCIAAILTLVLIFIPRESERPIEDISKIYDSLFLWRISLVLLLGLSAAGGGVFFLLDHLMEPRVAKPIKRWTL